MRVLKTEVHTGFAVGVYYDETELPEDWDDMSEKEREDWIEEISSEMLHNYCYVSATIVEE